MYESLVVFDIYLWVDVQLCEPCVVWRNFLLIPVCCHDILHIYDDVCDDMDI